MTTEERGSKQEASQANGVNLNANKGDKGGQDAENQDNAVEDDCIIGLDATDVWDDDEKDKPRRRSWDRARGEKKRSSREREKERDNNRSRRRSRSRGRRSRSRGRRSRSHGGRRSRSNERRRELSRRDPSKSNKDIEQDKLRAKKDNDSKILAEKEKAIKTLLDSDNVLPPGTETEAIQTIVEKNQQEQEFRNQEDRNRVSRDNKKRSPIHSRLGPKKLSKSPIRLSPLRRDRRSPFSPGRRRRSIERESSYERKMASRRRLRERLAARRSRSRSRDRRRSRSRSYERRRSRSGGRRSRSPFERRIRRRTLSRSRSPDRTRRRSPFINELARQFSHEAILPEKPLGGPGPMAGYPGAVPPLNPRLGILPTPGMPGPSMMNPMHPGVGVVHPAAPIIHPGVRGPPFLGYDGPSSRPFEPPMNPMGPAPVDFPGPAPVDFPGPMFTQGLMNPVPPHSLRPVSPVPQPVPAPIIGQGGFTAVLGAALPHQPSNAVSGSRDRYSPNPSYSNRRSGSPGDKIFRNKSKREERMKTPEPPKPPIISDVVKPVEEKKTSLSSLLEASVSNKDTSSTTSTFKGYRPEIMRHCERALRSLPTEDPRLKMKGRFFFEPTKKDDKIEKPAAGSNSILLRKGRTEIYWDDEEDQMPIVSQASMLQQTIRRVASHQKYCQTEETARESVAVQAEETPKQMTDFSQQVVPLDLMPPAEETRRGPPAAMMEDNRRVPSIDDIRRPIEDNRRAAVMEDTRRVAMEENRRPVDRLDWSMRETYDHGADRLRDNEDLRWNLNNVGGGNSGGGGGIGATASGPRMGERLPWSRGFSPKPIDHMHGNAAVNMPMNNEYMRNERDMDMRDRDIDIRMDMRVLEMLRERERLMGGGGGGAGVGVGVGGMGNRPAMLDDFSTRRQTVKDDFDMRKNYGGGSSSGGGGGPGSVGSYNRAMDMMDKDRNEPLQFGDSPIPDDPDDELEIIEERGPWNGPTRNTAPTTAAAAAATFGNVRGGNVGGGGGVGSNVNRSFRGRLGGYRNY